MADGLQSLRASIAANTRWSRTPDRRAATAPGRRAAMERFERLVDPDGVLDPATRARLAENARRAHMQRAALASVKARRRKAKESRRAGPGGGEEAGDAGADAST